MKRSVASIAAFALALALSACGGKGEHRTSGAAWAPCPILADASAVLGHGASGFSVEDDGAVVSCEWTSTDGVIDAGLMTYDTHAAEPAPAHFQSLIDEWKKDSFGESVDLPGLGDQAAYVANMSGGQTQLVMRKGDTLAVVLVSSGDPRHSSEDLAKAFATSVAAAWP